MLLILCLLIPANVILFFYWSNLINFRSLSYLSDISEIASSFSVFAIILCIIVLISFVITTIYIFRKFAFRFFEIVYTRVLNKTLSWISILILLVVMIRGGLQMLPMNESLVSFSENNFINQATINPAWHLANDVYRAGIFAGNPFETMTEEKAEDRFENLMTADPDSFPQVILKNNPNIVIIILESLTAEVVGAMGGDSGVTPELDKIIEEGILFSHIYSSGTRTDQGIVSLLNGWPATPYYSIMRSTEKSKALPSLPAFFLSKGYETSFFYGGESNFSNLNMYCTSQKFQNIIDINSFSILVPRGRWGVDDEYVFNRQLDQKLNGKEPFFCAIMTLSNHEPFDVPLPVRFTGTTDADKFRNSAAYTDASLGNYFAKARTQPWYKNTLFIITADHGHSLPGNKNIYYPESHKIPFVFYGDVVSPEFRGAVITKTGGHHDLAGTLLPQLEMDAHNSFRWSKNLLNPTVKSFAYFQIEHVLGWIEPDYWYGYSYNRNKFLARSYNVPMTKLDTLSLQGKAFIQLLYEQYRKY